MFIPCQFPVLESVSIYTTCISSNLYNHQIALKKDDGTHGPHTFLGIMMQSGGRISAWWWAWEDKREEFGADLWIIEGVGMRLDMWLELWERKGKLAIVLSLGSGKTVAAQIVPENS